MKAYQAAARLRRSVEQVTADTRFHTPDLSGTATTEEVTGAVVTAIRDGRANRGTSDRTG